MPQPVTFRYACPKCSSKHVGYALWWRHDAVPGVFGCQDCRHEGERHDFAVIPPSERSVEERLVDELFDGLNLSGLEE